ncbi:hypothetical protein [Shewanella sp. KJ2020]|uniref:hypothetical protein n=1 Tax=Shewanella sp. KJ2020 TaxID=2919172 RepID=UPI0020A7F1E8|nr:hypothetical protein [Shewanella sp. KJ2020]MCP3129313.1 hypothetical protein [Shewanella sp. KJ2020]
MKFLIESKRLVKFGIQFSTYIITTIEKFNGTNPNLHGTFIKINGKQTAFSGESGLKYNHYTVVILMSLYDRR